MSVMLPSLLTKLATCVDPFAYALSQPKIRRELLRRLHRLSTVMHSSGPVFKYPDRTSHYYHQRDQISAPSALLDCSSQHHLTVWGRSNVRTDYNIKGRLHQYSYHSRRLAHKGNVGQEDDGIVNITEPRHSFIIPHITFSESKNNTSNDGKSELHSMSISKRTVIEAIEIMDVDDAEVVKVIDNHNHENGRNEPIIFTVNSSTLVNVGDINDTIRFVHMNDHKYIITRCIILIVYDILFKYCSRTVYDVFVHFSICVVLLFRN